MRFFNTGGPVSSDKHYSLPPLQRWDLEEILSLIEQEKYFLLHASIYACVTERSPWASNSRSGATANRTRWRRVWSNWTAIWPGWGWTVAGW